MPQSRRPLFKISTLGCTEQVETIIHSVTGTGEQIPFFTCLVSLKSYLVFAISGP